MNELDVFLTTTFIFFFYTASVSILEEIFPSFEYISFNISFVHTLLFAALSPNLPHMYSIPVEKHVMNT